jgi:hypothetical protein
MRLVTGSVERRGLPEPSFSEPASTYLTGQEVRAWLLSWGGSGELAPPEVHF